MTRIITILLTLLAVALPASADDFCIDAHVFFRHSAKTVGGRSQTQTDIPGALIYITNADGSVRDNIVRETLGNGTLLYRDARTGRVIDERLRLPNKVGRYVVHYILSDRLRYERTASSTYAWQAYSGGTYTTVASPQQAADYHGQQVIDLNNVSGTSVTLSFEVKLSDTDQKDFLNRSRSAEVRVFNRTGAALGPQADDGSQEGGYEVFPLRFLIHKDSIRPDRRIVAQPVWVDKKLELTYYGDPLAYYGREFAIWRQRESGYQPLPVQEGLYFLPEGPNARRAYAQGQAFLADSLGHHLLTPREDLHYPQINCQGQRAADSLYFRLPMYIKVPETARQHDCTALVRWVITDYHHILSEGCDTIIEGRNNPMQYLTYTLGGLLDEGSRDLHSERYWLPEAMQGAHEAGHNLKIYFDTGRTDIDWTKPGNLAERAVALRDIDNVNQPGNNLLGIHITGYASPDGRAAYNEKLAYQRAQSFRTWLLTTLPSAVNYVTVDSRIAPWTAVADTLRAWGRLSGEIGSEATESEIRSSVSDDDLRLALDAVRVIDFRLSYEILAAYTPEELLEMHQQKGSLPQDFMYRDIYRHKALQGQWAEAEHYCEEIYTRKADAHRASLAALHRLSREYTACPATDSLRQDSLSRQVVRHMAEAHELLVYANDLCAIKLTRGEADTTLLQPFTILPDCRLRDTRHGNVTVAGIPDIVLLNQAAAYLSQQRTGWARSYLRFYQQRDFPDQSRLGGPNAQASRDIQILQDVLQAKTAPADLTSEQVASLEAIHPVNGVVGALALASPTADDMAHAREIVLSPTLLSDSIATNNVVRALWYGRDFARRAKTYRLSPHDYFDTDLTQGARYLQAGLRQNPALREGAEAQRDLKPVFRVLQRIQADEQVAKSIRLIRRNSAKNPLQ